MTTKKNAQSTTIDSQANDEEGNKSAENVSSNIEGNQKPKLDEGFFEIEAVRNKRVRKGEVQYLIKWREFPEAANTWEPLWNLESCPYLIDAFEESLPSGKQRKCKGIRKDGNTRSQSKKKKQLSSPTVIERKRGQSLVPSNGGIGSTEIANSGHDQTKEDDGHSIKLDILPKVTEQNGNENPANKNGILDTNGAKPAACARSDALAITEIIKSVSFSTSVYNNDQKVEVKFMVRRSDGVEIIASNKYLKDHHPLMLIDFYERNMKP